MTMLERLYTEYGQSPWLDNLTRGYLRDGTLKRMVADGIRRVPAIQAMIAEGRSINITLIFSLARYGQVIGAYLSGLEALVERGGDVSRVHSVASFFVSRVDTEVDRRLETAGSDEALALRGRA